MGPADAFPETLAGGYSRRDGTVAFYSRVNALLQPHHVVVDLGAGRGEWLEDTVSYRKDLRLLRGKVARVIGVDIDPVVMSNRACDDAIVMDAGTAIPLPSETVDLVVSDHTMEHVAHPGPWASEIQRVLRPGGWLVGRTPNRFGYIGLATNAVPNKWHGNVLQRAQPRRKDIDVFPTVYELNTRRALQHHFPYNRWRHCTYAFNPEPAYFGDSRWIVRLADGLLSRAPSALSATWHVFVQKRRQPHRHPPGPER